MFDPESSKRLRIIKVQLLENVKEISNKIKAHYLQGGISEGHYRNILGSSALFQ